MWREKIELEIFREDVKERRETLKIKLVFFSFNNFRREGGNVGN